MNGIDTKLRVIWLSDIHYRAQYKDKSKDLKEFLTSFHNYVDTIIEKDKKIDYILLSGDIAQEGSSADYNQFKDDILTDLQKKLPDAKLLIVPGNHDVYRQGANYKKKFIESLSERKTRFEFFSKDLTSFINAFENYNDAFIDNTAFHKDSSKTYREGLLYGHVIDKEKRIIFVLLNSSWYSIGEDFLKEYLDLEFFETDVKAKEPDAKPSAMRKLRAVEVNSKDLIKNIQNIADEYGKQLIGLQSLNIQDILDDLELYNDFMVVTIMHHPINWLDWDERINNGTDKFHVIRRHTDLLLTGHEHVPRMQRSERINEILHIPAGCFMYAAKEDTPYSFPKDSLTNQNWFSMLHINSKKRTVKQRKHYFNVVSKNWLVDEEMYFENLNKKYSSTLSVGRRGSIKQMLDKADGCKILINKIFPGKPIFQISHNFFSMNDVGEEKLYIFIKDMEISIDFEDIKREIDKRIHSLKEIYFVFTDLYNIGSVMYLNRLEVARQSINELQAALVVCRSNEKEIESMKDAEFEERFEKLRVLDYIKNDFDFKFDKFRYKFFSELNQDEAVKYQEIKFISIIKPYWEVEAHFNS